jgi:hypothetical protein
MEGNTIAAFFLSKCRHAGYDDRGGAKELASPEELARDIRAALGAMREARRAQERPLAGELTAIPDRREMHNSGTRQRIVAGSTIPPGRETSCECDP